MNRTLRLVVVTLLCTGVLTREKICEHVGFGQTTFHHGSADDTLIDGEIPSSSPSQEDYFINDSLYQWDEYLLDWVAVGVYQDWPAPRSRADDSFRIDTEKPVEISWGLLTDIRYRLRYFDVIGAEMFAPVYSDSLHALQGRKVSVKGHVIPLDDDGNILALSQNSYASCFFCGKASPASIISMHLEEENKWPKLDEIKTFQGTLHLNKDDPNDFYYVLQNAEAD